MPIIKIPDELPDGYLPMPKGLEGYWWETEHVICVPFVSSQCPGDGTFSSWLRNLEAKGKLVFFPTIVSKRLETILRARGYTDAFVIDDEMGFVDGLAKGEGVRE